MASEINAIPIKGMIGERYVERIPAVFRVCITPMAPKKLWNAMVA
jgi:hypothetical protein